MDTIQGYYFELELLSTLVTRNKIAICLSRARSAEVSLVRERNREYNRRGLGGYFGDGKRRRGNAKECGIKGVTNQAL